MPQDPIQAYCEKVCIMVRWKPCHTAITAELSAHMEDHADHLITKGADPNDAKARAAAAMGDPYAIGKELDALRSPWYPRLSRIFTVLAALLLLASLVTRANSKNPYPIFAPFADPAELVLVYNPSTAPLATGNATGGGSLGAYSFTGQGAAAIFKTDFTDKSGAPVYRLDIVLPVTTPWFWLTGPALHLLPGHLDGSDKTSIATIDEQGIFRRFCRVTVPVTPPFRSSYTLELGENSAVSYTVILREVPQS